MNNHLDPEVYANFVNTLGISVMVPDALPMFEPAIRDSPILNPPEESRERITVRTSDGAAQQYYDEQWPNFKSA
jgi:hypothetical protein